MLAKLPFFMDRFFPCLLPDLEPDRLGDLDRDLDLDRDRDRLEGIFFVLFFGFSGKTESWFFLKNSYLHTTKFSKGKILRDSKILFDLFSF